MQSGKGIFFTLGGWTLVAIVGAGFPTPGARAQPAPASTPQTAVPPAAIAATPDEAGSWSLHGQATMVEQWHYGFPSPYEGPLSFSGTPESDYTLSFSVYLGRRLWSGAELVYNPEFFNGYGLSHTLGIAGFPSGEAIKAGFPHLHYNTSRLFLSQTIGFGGGDEAIPDGPNQLAGRVDTDRLVLTFGRFAAGDYFDDNAYSHDSRTQFMNWAILESGAWDMPGDVVGFTVGGVAEWHTRTGSLRYGLVMEPLETNSPSLDPRLRRAFGQILEFDHGTSLGQGRDGVLRPFVYVNHANMGLFTAADAQPGVPDIAATREYRTKEGLGVSWDQALSPDWGVFTRLSWNDGRTEDIAYSEIDRSAAAGVSLKGTSWSRPDDAVGVAGALDGLASEHKKYLERGGIGFVIGDGALSYAPEEIVEAYYSLRLCKWLSLSPDFQYIEHPGYNSARGGVAVYAVRAHLEF